MSDDPFNATLIERHDLHEELSIVRIAPDSGQAPVFEPGQFTTLGLPQDESTLTDAQRARPRKGPRLVRRAYSIASASTQRDYLEFYITLVESGRLTTKLWTVQQGNRLFMDDKCSGHFILGDVPSDKDLVMIATGTGLAPFVSMLRTYRGQNRWRRFVLIHSVRLVRDLGYHEELLRIAHESADVFYIPTVTREPLPSAWAGHRGRPQTIVEDHVYEKYVGASLDPAQCHVFLCGNPVMIESVQQLLETRDFVTDRRDRPGNIHFERYW